MEPGWEEAALMMNKDTMRVNSLTFCKHGHEYCNHCSADHRLGNDEELSGESSVTEAEINMAMEAFENERGSDAYDTKLIENLNAMYLGRPKVRCSVDITKLRLMLNFLAHTNTIVSCRACIRYWKKDRLFRRPRC